MNRCPICCRRAAWIALLLALWLLPLTAHSQGRPPTPVIVSEVLNRQVHDEIILVGTVQPRRSSLVASETEGKVVSRFKEGGQSVVRGEIIFRLDNHQLRAALIEALADVKLEEFNHAQSMELLRHDAVSEQDLRASEYEFDRARAKLQDIQSRLEAMAIRAPFDGHIIQTLTEVGEWISHGDAIARVISTDTVRVYVNVPEGQVDRLHVGDETDVFIGALGSNPMSGQIVAILAEGYAESRTFPVVVEVLNPSGRIRSNMSARALFKIQQPDTVLLVHKDALVNSPDGPIVYLAIDDKAVSRPLVPGLAYNGYISVEGELQPGDLAIVRGNERLRDDQAIRIIRKQQ